MNYQETLDYMYSQLPMFHRIGAAAYKANLDNTIAICKLLGNPEKKFKSIHIAGTNGKGSTSHMVAYILQESGLKVGLFTSPHLKDFRERIKINGKEISKNYVVNFIQKHQEDFEKIKPSFFEMTVGLAFNYFAEKKVDIAIIEVGLGGRLDSTNVIIPELSVITNISYDHMNLLGNSLEKIARQKAGIIKQNIPVIIGEKQKATESIFRKIARNRKSKIVFADDLYSMQNTLQKEKKGKQLLIGDIYKNKKIIFKNLECDLAGLYQKKNICTALSCIDELKNSGWSIPGKNIKSGIKNVVANTGLMGRWQILAKSPLVITDTAHNEAGIKEVLANIWNSRYKKLHFILGMVSDKDITKILKLLPKKAAYYFCKPGIPRGLDENILEAEAKKFKLQGKVFPNVKRAIQCAKKNASRNDLIFIGGSTFVVAEAL
jgi:dihydrofolate synthase/folylpolyglutamate synthase